MDTDNHYSCMVDESIYISILNLKRPWKDFSSGFSSVHKGGAFLINLALLNHTRKNLYIKNNPATMVTGLLGLLTGTALLLLPVESVSLLNRDTF